FFDIPVGQRVPKIPPDRTENDRRLGLSPFENCWSDGHFRSPSRLSASIQKVATHPFHQSLMSQMARSIGKWCKYEAVMKTRSYNLFEAVDQREEPPWPPEGLPFLIRKAFKDRVIATPDHPVLMKRRSHLK